MVNHSDPVTGTVAEGARTVASRAGDRRYTVRRTVRARGVGRASAGKLCSWDRVANWPCVIGDI